MVDTLGGIRRIGAILGEQAANIDSVELDRLRPAPWGLWTTIGFSLAIGLVYIVACTVLCIGFIIAAKVRNPQLDIAEFANTLGASGWFLAMSTYVAAPVVIGLSVFFAAIRKNITVREYLCFRWPPWKHLVIWSLILLFYNAFSTLLSWLLGRPVISDFMVKTYTTAGFKPALWLGFIILAPLYEEIFFRGFAFKAVEYSRLGRIGAVILTALAWSALHIQCDFFGVVDVFVGGLLLGWARLRSKSVCVPIVMHIVQNLVATITVAVYLVRA